MGILQDLLGESSKKASNAAALDTFQKQQGGISDLKAYGDQYAGQYKGLAQQYQPYQQAGNSSLQMLLNGLGFNGADGNQAFTTAYQNRPGYASGLNAGGEAVAGNANAGNMLQSGKTLKDLQRFGQDYDSQREGDYFAKLMGLQGQGLQATNQAVSTEGQGLNGQLATRQGAFGGQMQSAGTIGQGQIAGEQAKQGALTNIMNVGGYLAGSAMGGGGLGRGVSSFTNLFNQPKTTYGAAGNYGVPTFGR